MPNRINDKRLFIVKNQIDHPIIANPQFVETGQLASQRFQSRGLHVLRKPTHALDDATCDWLVKPRQIASSRSRT